MRQLKSEKIKGNLTHSKKREQTWLETPSVQKIPKQKK